MRKYEETSYSENNSRIFRIFAGILLTTEIDIDEE